MEVVLTRTVRASIPEIIEDYLFSKSIKDIDECQEVQARFNAVYEESSAKVREGIKGFISKYLTLKKLDPKADLDNIFSKVLT